MRCHKSLKYKTVGSVLRSRNLAMFAFVILLASLLVLTSAERHELPDFITVCYRDDPKFNECVRKNLETLFPKFMNGDPKLDLPPFEPFHFEIRNATVRQGNLYGGANMKNSTAIGMKGMVFRKVRTNLSNPRKFEMGIDFFIPSLFLEGDYDAQGRLIVFNLNGSGIYNASMKNVDSTWTLRGDVVDGEDGEQYIQLKRFGLRTQIGSFKFYATKLFGNNAQINKAILRFINKSWRTLVKRLASTIDNSFNNAMLPLANKVFLSIPYNSLFPLSGVKPTEGSASGETELPVSEDAETPTTETFSTTMFDDLDYFTSDFTTTEII